MFVRRLEGNRLRQLHRSAGSGHDFSDFGADVVKIEPPGAGDPYRHLTKLPGHPKSDQNYAWMLGSRNKRSLAVDMGKPEGRTAVQRLASQADVFITNYPAAVRKSLASAMKHCRR